MKKQTGECFKHGETDYTYPDKNFNSYCVKCCDEALKKCYLEQEIKHDEVDFSMGAKVSSFSEDCVSGSASMCGILVYHGNKSISDRAKKKINKNVSRRAKKREKENE